MKAPKKNRYFLKSFLDFCENTSVPGFKIIVATDMPLIEKILCVIVNLSVFVMSMYIFGQSLQAFNENPTAVSLDNQSYDVENLFFPTVAVCNINQISRKRVYEYANFLAQKKYGIIATKRHVEQYFKKLQYMGQLLVYNSDATPEMVDFQIDLDNLDPDPATGFWNAEKAMFMMAPKCEEHIFNVKFNGKNYNTTETFILHKADEGYCCMFNNMRPPYSKIYDDFRIKGVKTYPVKVGKSNGLQFLVVNNLSDYYFATMNMLGFQLLTFNPFEYPEALTGNYRRDFLQMGQTSIFEIETEVYRANMEISRYSKYKRGCVFFDEEFERYKGLYKFTECLLRCRMESIKALCHCLPYFVPMNFKDIATNDTLVCSLHHLSCLYKYRLKFRTWMPLMTNDFEIDGLRSEVLDGMYCPGCFPDCLVTKYTLSGSVSDLINLQRSFGNLSNNTIDSTKSTLVKIYYSKQTTSIYYADLVYSIPEMLSVFGAILSVIFGVSIISVLEILYFGIWRTYQYYNGHFDSEDEDNETTVNVNNYKSIELALLKIGVQKNVYPQKMEFMPEIRKYNRKTKVAWQKNQQYD